MTFALLVAVAAAFLSTPATHALDDTRYTVWSTVIFSRTGERTPATLGHIPTQLTSLGAQQQYAMGQFFRERYLTSMGSADGINSAVISGMATNIPDWEQMYVFGLQYQWTLASAQAFMQGFYPPFQLIDNDTEVQTSYDPTSVLANTSYIENPLNGYQYSQIQSWGPFDPEYPYIGGNLECQGWTEAASEYSQSPAGLLVQEQSSSIYQDIGPVFLEEVGMTPNEWGYVNAYVIYDYLSYLNQHNSTAQSLFSNPDFINPATNISYLDRLRWYADEQQFGQLGSLYAVNNVTSTPFPEGVSGSISTLSGNMLAAKMASLLQWNIATEGKWNKFNLLVGDYQPLVSFFALMNLPALDSNFYGLPEYGSVAVLEMFSKTDSSDGTTYPSADDLWVRFYFNNGTTDPNETYRAYPLFGLGPDQFELPWGTFIASMQSVGIGDMGIWCDQCGPQDLDATRVFCSYWNSSNSLDGTFTDSGSSHNKLSPAVSGVIGAIVALVIAGIVFGAIMLIGGVRFHRVHGRKSDLGGFKGSQKLASDKDLTLPKGGAVVGATVETPGSPVPGGHERVGSWELKQHDLPNIAATHPARRPSFEEDEEVDIANRKPVKPDERV